MNEPNESNPIRMVKKDCGIHSGMTAGPCAKCAHVARQNENPNIRKGRQYGGTPYVALISAMIGPSFPRH